MVNVSGVIEDVARAICAASTSSERLWEAFVPEAVAALHAVAALAGPNALMPAAYDLERMARLGDTMGHAARMGTAGMLRVLAALPPVPDTRLAGGGPLTGQETKEELYAMLRQVIEQRDASRRAIAGLTK